jgi:plasmid stabilization system protein ParE
MSEFVLTPEAEEDLFQIWRYIAADDPDSANLVEQAVYEACAFLAEHPLCGHFRTDLTSPRALLDTAAI